VSGHGDGTPGALRPRDEIGRMFGRIVPRYDAMNRLMTGGRDVAWRDLTVRLALAGYGRGTARVLDVATGTGDLALALAAAGAGEVVGLDLAEPMLRAAQTKARRRDDGAGVTWVVGDALRMPFSDGRFDACTVSFGLRNMPDYAAALSEMARVLRPGGRFFCLELTPLRAPLVGPAFDLYFRRVVPVVGGLLSGDFDAYRYLPTSVAAFPDAPTLAGLMREAGFAEVGWRRLGAGTVALHGGVRAG
jgi:demethylmenaquinone methyltransferase / 2-methoxy-6-polyprenyl-1,4-benzoquinol methylase